MEGLYDQLESFGDLKLPKITDDLEALKNYPFYEEEDFCLLEERLQKRFIVLNDFGDLNILNKEKELLCKVDAFIWNLWRKRKEEMLIDDDPDPINFCEPPVSASSVTSDMSKDALLCMIQFMYTNDMNGDFKKLLEIFEKANSNGRNELISITAGKMLATKISLQSLVEIWDETCATQNLANQTLVNYTLSYILSRPEEAFAIIEGKVWEIPAKLLELLLPQQLAIRLQDYQGICDGRWTCKIEWIDKMCYIGMNHLQLAEFLYLWAQQIYAKSTTTGQIAYQTNFTIFEVHQILGNLFTLLNQQHFNVTTMNGVQISDTTPMNIAKGIYYYYIVVLAQFIPKTEKQVRKITTFGAEFSEAMEEALPQPQQQYKRARYDHDLNIPSGIAPTTTAALAQSDSDIQEPINPILEMLSKEFQNPTLVDTHFIVENEIVKAHSFILSLWSSAFFLHFQKENAVLHTFKLGNVTADNVKIFVQAFYTGCVPQKEGLEDFLANAVCFRVTPFVKQILPFMSSENLNGETAVIRYMAEKAANDERKMASYFSFIKSNIIQVLKSRAIATHADKNLMMNLMQCQIPDEDEFKKIEAAWRWCQFQCILQNQAVVEHAPALMKGFKQFFKLENITNEEMVIVLDGMKLLTTLEALQFCEERGKKLGSK